jgi:NAD(P)-dependent dehydrogenase (short-subunit alcohol dehydrogenase family)
MTTTCQTEPEASTLARPLFSQNALVTGASGGIGRAVALALARQGANLNLVGRSATALAEIVDEASQLSSVKGCQLDLTDDNGIESTIGNMAESETLDILVHSAGIFHQSRMADASLEDFDRQYAVNLRAPYALTQRLLPRLIASQGQIVFINSTVGLASKRPEVGQYAAMKHALKAIADSLREEVNPKGVRVLTVYLGRTATPMQEAIFREEGRPYRPETLLQPKDIASLVVHALCLPRTVEVTDISIRPMADHANSGPGEGN